MFTREDGPTALRADLLRGLSFSSFPEDVQTDDHSGSALAGVSSVWNGSRGFVVVLIRFIDPPHVERYKYSEPLTDESMLALAQAEGLRFAGAMGFRMDDPGFQELEEAARANRLLNWNLIREVRAPSAAEKPVAAADAPAAAAPAAVSAAPTVEASNDEEVFLLESPIQTESPLEPVEESVPAPELAELLEKVEGLFDEPAHPTAPAPSAPPSEPEGEIPLGFLVLEEDDDTPVSLEPVNAVVPATEEAGPVSPVTEPNVFEFDESTDSEAVHAEPAADDALQQLLLSFF